MKLFVIGNPVKHSKSPKIHNLWLKKSNEKVIYEKKLLSEQQLNLIVEKVRNQECLGFNVTLPFKTKILKFLDQYEDNVKKIKAVNTVYIKEDKVIGANTDGEGLIQSLKNEAKMNLNNIKVFVFGAGGASRGILFELTKLPVKEICICNRSFKNAKRLQSDLSLSSGTCKIKLQKWQKKSISEQYNLIINTTSYGMSPRENLHFNFSSLKKNTVVYDLIYSPEETSLLKKAKKLKLKNYNGEGMLVRQAAQSFSRWFKKKLTEKDIIEAKRVIFKK